MSWKIKKTFAKDLWYWDAVLCKWVNFSSKCSQPNVEEINLLLSSFQKEKKRFLLFNGK